MMLRNNVGATDRIVRIVIGVALLLWFFVDNGAGFWHWAKLIGIVPLVTAATASCPLYTMLGLSTCPVKQA